MKTEICYKLKKVIVLGLCMCILVSLGAPQVKAYTPLTDENTEGAIGKLTASTIINADVPLLSTCNVKSKGTSNITFLGTPKGYANHCISHKIIAKTGGLGFGINGGHTTIYYADTFDWSYTIYSDIWRLYSYRETHDLQYKIRKSGKSTITITLSDYVKY